MVRACGGDRQGATAQHVNMGLHGDGYSEARETPPQLYSIDNERLKNSVYCQGTCIFADPKK
jgi:hypothetical protein